MKNIIYLILIYSSSIIAQNKHDNYWILQNTELSSPSHITWYGDSIKATKGEKVNQYLAICNAIISDKEGQLKFYGNGCFIYGKNHIALPNGKNINPGEIGDKNCVKYRYYPLSREVLFLNCPDDTSRYYAFHNRLSEKYVWIAADTVQDRPINTMFYSEISTKLNKGIGDIVKKSVEIVTDTILGLHISACRHANGKDWWVIVPQINTLGFQKVLLTKEGPRYMGQQVFQHNKMRGDLGTGQLNISNDGKTLVMGDPINGKIFVFDFDRCTGLFSNLRTIETGYRKTICTGLEVSPNGKLLYAADGQKLTQYDLLSPDLINSGITIDTFDGYVDEYPTGFYQCQLAPNGKIYIGTTSSTRIMHTIHQPDVRGKGCDFRQHDFRLPGLYYVGLSSLPNFNLGASDPNCAIPLATEEVLAERDRIAYLYPNPTKGNTTLHFTQIIDYQKGTLVFYNLTGQQVAQIDVQTVGREFNLELSNLPKGIYLYSLLLDGYPAQSGKVIIE